MQNEKKTLIYYSESYHHSLLKLQAKTIVLTGANLVHDSFWLMFLALQRVLLKDIFHHFYKLLPFFSFFPSYQNLLETDNNPNPHWLSFLEGFYNCFTIPGIQGWFSHKILPIINLYIFPITLIDLHNNMTINICSALPQKDQISSISNSFENSSTQFHTCNSSENSFSNWKTWHLEVFFWRLLKITPFSWPFWKTV